MPNSPYHKDRLREQLTREIADVITNDVRDPRVPAFFTITSVKLSDDQRDATVRVSMYDGDVDAAMEAMNKAAPFIQKLVSQRIKMKNFPHLMFKSDNSLHHTDKINKLLDTVKDDLV